MDTLTPLTARNLYSWTPSNLTSTYTRRGNYNLKFTNNLFSSRFTTSPLYFTNVSTDANSFLKIHRDYFQICIWALLSCLSTNLPTANQSKRTIFFLISKISFFKKHYYSQYLLSISYKPGTVLNALYVLSNPHNHLLKNLNFIGQKLKPRQASHLI